MFTCKTRPPASSADRSSVLMYNGHQPLVRFCLNRFIIGMVPSVLTISRLQSFAVLAPLGKRFKSSVIAPKKSSLLKWSASQTCRLSLAGTYKVEKKPYISSLVQIQQYIYSKSLAMYELIFFTLLVVSSHENIDSFFDITTFSSAAK